MSHTFTPHRKWLRCRLSNDRKLCAVRQWLIVMLTPRYANVTDVSHTDSSERQYIRVCSVYAPVTRAHTHVQRWSNHIFAATRDHCDEQIAGRWFGISFLAEHNGSQNTPVRFCIIIFEVVCALIRIIFFYLFFCVCSCPLSVVVKLAFYILISQTKSGSWIWMMLDNDQRLINYSEHTAQMSTARADSERQ